MELPELLELLYSARTRSQTVRATVRRWSDEARLLELMRARGDYQDPPPIPPEEGSWGKPASRIEARTELWAARPNHLRWESDFFVDGKHDGRSVGVKEGELFWQRFPGSQDVDSNEHRQGVTITTEGERLLDPAPLLGSFLFDVRGETSWLSRPALRVEAARRPDGDHHDFGPLTDTLQLLVDRERGFLLKASAYAAGSEISRTEIVELVLDEPLSGELFRPLR